MSKRDKLPKELRVKRSVADKPIYDQSRYIPLRKKSNVLIVLITVIVFLVVVLVFFKDNIELAIIIVAFVFIIFMLNMALGRK
ncbi:MAG: hypothetical protein KKH01_10180 [Firmicutes bacterium]|nr:hypothetical protein [Bacillota bacterium]